MKFGTIIGDIKERLQQISFPYYFSVHSFYTNQIFLFFFFFFFVFLSLLRRFLN